MKGRRRNPEAEIQRAVVACLRAVLPPGSIVHHSPNEQRGGGGKAAQAQAIGVGMGIHAGFADLQVIAEGRVLFLEVKSRTGRLSPEQELFRDDVRAQGFAWALVRSVDDALEAVEAAGISTRIVRAP